MAASQKRWEIGPRLLEMTNRKSHKLFHMTQKSYASFPTSEYGRPSLAEAGLLVTKYSMNM